MPLPGGPNKALAVTLFLISLSVAPLGHAQCEEPTVPSFPAIQNADLSDMEAADIRMQRYVNETEEYLECLSSEERKLRTDAILAKMKQVTSEYNAFAVAYRKSKTRELFSNSGE